MNKENKNPEKNTLKEEEIELQEAEGVDEIDIEDDPLPEEQIKSLEDQLLRAQAEVQNVRRIAAQEVTKARLFGVESLAKEFLAVADNLERAIHSCEDTEVKEGLELTLKSLENSLKTANIEPINTEDTIFDPEKHEAISVIEDESVEANTIIDFVQKGYTILDRTLRPAKVVVSKKSQEN